MVSSWPSSSPTSSHEVIHLVSHRDIKMIAETVKAVFNYSPAAPAVPAVPAAPEAEDGNFKVVARAYGTGFSTSVKVGGHFGERATESLVQTTAAANKSLAQTTAAANESLVQATAAANQQLITTAAIAAVPFIIGGLGGLAIKKMAGRSVPKVPTTMGAKPRIPFAMRTKTERT